MRLLASSCILRMRITSLSLGAATALPAAFLLVDAKSGEKVALTLPGT